VRLPPQAHDWVGELTERWIEYLQQSGVQVIGDVADLRPVRPEEGTAWHNPDRVPARQRLHASLDALAAMTREAASRPDPEQQLIRRMRANAGRFRNR
jgi:hypothetical protein